MNFIHRTVKIHTSRTLAAIFCALSLSSCVSYTQPPAMIAESGGVGRTDPDGSLPSSVRIDEENAPPSELSSPETQPVENGQPAVNPEEGQPVEGQPPVEEPPAAEPVLPPEDEIQPIELTPPEPVQPVVTEPDPIPEQPLQQTGAYWYKENGKYVYNLPKRDTSGLATIEEMYTTPCVPMEDQPDDWFPGKWNYDASTGEATCVWDRWSSTMDIIHKYHAIYTGDESRRVCYLTFDCGYEFGTTGRILDTLREKEVPGLFFVTGDYVETEYDLMKRMLDEGHLIGNHTVDHVRMNTVSVDEFQRQLNELETMFCEQFPNAQPMIYFRPPSGACNEWTFKLADKMGYKTVMWSATYKDYDTENQWSYEDALATCKNQLRPGVVYLLHAESETNTAILGTLIDWIRGQGYEILPMCDYEP